MPGSEQPSFFRLAVWQLSETSVSNRVSYSMSNPNELTCAIVPVHKRRIHQRNKTQDFGVMAGATVSRDADYPSK